MKTKKDQVTTIDEYIASFPGEVREKLQALRKTIQEAAPLAKEKISYRMPTYTLEGNLVHFAAYTRHIGFYPTPSGIETFKEELGQYEWGKGSVQFPLDKPLPLELIGRMVKFRVQENLHRADENAKKKPKV